MSVKVRETTWELRRRISDPYDPTSEDFYWEILKCIITNASYIMIYVVIIYVDVMSSLVRDFSAAINSRLSLSRVK